MQHGSPLTAQVHFAVRVVPVGRKRKVEANPDKGNRSKRKPAIKEVQHYGVDYAIDSSDLRFLAGKEGQRLELSIEVATFAGDGRLLNSLSGICSNDLKPSTLKDIVAGGVRIHQEIDVPIQAVTLRLAVQDRTSSYLGSSFLFRYPRLPISLGSSDRSPRSNLINSFRAESYARP